MILVDSSVWITYYRPSVPEKIEILLREIISGCAVYHMDSHFDVIAKNTELKAKNLLA